MSNNLPDAVLMNILVFGKDFMNCRASSDC